MSINCSSEINFQETMEYSIANCPVVDFLCMLSESCSNVEDYMKDSLLFYNTETIQKHFTSGEDAYKVLASMVWLAKEDNGLC